MKWEKLCELGSELPEVAEGIWYRTPALTVRSKSFCRLKEDGENVVFLLHSVEQQEYLCSERADVYFITDHYRGYPAVLARLNKLKVGEARERLREAWLVRAPKKLAAELAR